MKNSLKNDKPAVYGGKPLFKTMVPIIRPTLCSFDRIIPLMRKTFLSGEVSVGSYVKRFEEACARYIGVKHVVAVSSATNGLMLAIKGLGLQGEVIVPSFTFTATVHSLIWNNITPVFIDCEPGTYSIDVNKIEELITKKTSAIMPVYIYGNPPDIDELKAVAKKHNLKLIFDSAQGFGAEYKGIKAGNFSDCEIFSLSPTKVLSSIEGGLVATNNDALADYICRGRDYGKGNDDIDFVGLSARPSEIHALIGLNNFKILKSCLHTRRTLIDLYKKLLGKLEGISFQEIKPGNKTSGNYMIIFVDKEKFGMSRDKLYEALKAENIQTKKYFYPSVHMQNAYKSYYNLYYGKLPVTEKAASQGLALPLYVHMKQDTVEKVCFAIQRIHSWH